MSAAADKPRDPQGRLCWLDGFHPVCWQGWVWHAARLAAVLVPAWIAGRALFAGDYVTAALALAAFAALSVPLAVIGKRRSVPGRSAADWWRDHENEIRRRRGWPPKEEVQ